MDTSRRFKTSGVTLVEVLVGISIVVMMLVAIGLAVNNYVAARTALLSDTKAAYLAEEGYEIVRALRDNNWATMSGLTTGTTYYLSVATSTIAVTNTPEVIDGEYLRSFVVYDAYRNGSDDITSSTTVGASADTDMKEVHVSVGGPSGTSTFTGLLGNLFQP